MSRLNRTMVQQFIEREKAKARAEMDSCMDKIFGQMKRKLMQFVAGQDNSSDRLLYTNSNQIPSSTQPSTNTFNEKSAQQEDDDEMKIVRNELGENVYSIIPNAQSNLIEIIGNDNDSDDLFIEEDEDENQDCDCSDCVVELCVVEKEVGNDVQQQQKVVEEQVNVNSVQNSKQNLNSVSRPVTKRPRLEKVPRNSFVTPRTILVSSTTNTNNQQPNPNTLNPPPTSPIHRLEKVPRNPFVPRTILVSTNNTTNNTNHQPNPNPNPVLNPPPTTPIHRLIEKPSRFVPRTILIPSTNTNQQPHPNPLNPIPPTSSPSLKCRKCARMFDDVHSVNAHLKDVHSIGLFKCGFTDKDKDCTRTFNNKLALEHHYRITHHRVYLPAD